MSRKKYAGVFLGLALTSAASTVYAVQFNAFADINYSGSDADNTTSSFALGGLDLHANQDIDAKTRAFVEYVFEDPGTGFVLDLERLYIERKLSDDFKISVGRFHSPLGYWNNTYHHGKLMYDTVNRPSFLEFEDASTAILPTHVVGLIGSGKVETVGGKIGYDVVAANNSSLTTDGFVTPASFVPGEIGINNSSSQSEKKLILGRVSYKPNLISLEVGVFGMNNPVIEAGGGAGSAAPEGSELISQRVQGFDVHYDNKKFDAMAEYYNFNNDDSVGTSGSHDATAYFVQFGYKVTSQFKTVYRHESLTFESTDPYFQYLGRGEGTHDIIALRYDLDESNAIKLGIDYYDSKLAYTETAYTLQWAFMLF